MKKLYMLTVACILWCATDGFAQTRYWRGVPGGNWTDPNNWSADGISTPATVPNGAGFTAIFDNGSPQVNIAGNIALQSLQVTNNVTAKLYTSVTTTLTLSGTTSGAPALKIDAGSRLEDSVDASVLFNVVFADNAIGTVNGTWYLAGLPSIISPGASTFSFPANPTLSNRLDVFGSIIVGNKGVASATGNEAYLQFNAGSEYKVEGNANSTPKATWAATSTIRVTGSVDAGISFIPPLNYGNFVFDCAGLTGDLNMPLSPNIVFQGNFQVLNTNGHMLILGYSNALGTLPITYTVNGNFQVSGSSQVMLGHNATTGEKEMIMQVGSFTQSGGVFDLRSAAVTKATTLKILGNFTQTGGSFTASSPTAPSATDFFVVELNGSTPQIVNLSSGTIDNANNFVTLKMNNPQGAQVQSSLSVGRLSWASLSKGDITVTAGQTLTVNNPANDAYSVNGPSADGYVIGTIARRTNANTAYSFPTGSATLYRPCEVIPSNASASTYSAAYFRAAYSNLTVNVPLVRVADNEYWMINRVAGSPAVVRLTLNGAVPGAANPNEIVVAKFDALDNAWNSVKGLTGNAVSPGNSASGPVWSEELNTFSPFTFGVLPGAPLPVYLVSFNARKINNSAAKLDWTITTNSNPDRFEILRSTDGSHFTSIGTVKAPAQQLTFTYQDDQLPKQTTWYQLKMIDQQGLVNMSRIVTVFNNSEGVVINSMLPTLVTGQAKLNISASSRATIRLFVTDMQGRVVLQQQSVLSQGSQDVWLQLGGLAAGAYQVTGYLDNGAQTKSFRFVKK